MTSTIFHLLENNASVLGVSTFFHLLENNASLLLAPFSTYWKIMQAYD